MDSSAWTLPEEEDRRRRQQRNGQKQWESTPPPLFVPQDWQREAVEQMYAMTGDCSEAIAMLQLYIKQLGWSKDQVADVMEERYGVRERSRLSNQQVEDLAHYLAARAPV